MQRATGEVKVERVSGVGSLWFTIVRAEPLSTALLLPSLSWAMA